jgi:type I restriction enzyme S subunit
MSRGRKPFSSGITDNWEKSFFNSIGHYITLINKGLSKRFRNEPLSNHIKIVGGFAFKNIEYKSSGIPIIRISDFNNERIILDSVVYYEESQFLEKYELKESDIIIALTGGTIGKLGIVQAGLGKLYLNQRVGKFDILNIDEFEKEYIYWIARGVEGIVKNLAWGAAIPNVSPKQIEELNFPIPTKDIQKNIIRFLNDLRNGNVNGEIYFENEIENEIKKIQEKQVKAREVQDELNYQLTQLENLNQAILQEAVQGKLVNPSTEIVNRDNLINQIEKDKIELIAKRKYKPLIASERPDIKELCFKIPKNWQWFRLGEVAFFQEGPGIRVWQFTKSGVKLLNVQNILKDDTVDYLNSDKYVSESEFNEKYKHFQIEDGDILWASSGASWGKIAWHEDPGFPIMLNTSTVRLKFLSDKLYDPYLFYFLKTEFFKVQMIHQLMGMQPNFGATHLSRTYIPIPPLEEQKRIVAEIEKQLSKTKQLKEHIIANQQATEQLLKSFLHQAFEVEEMEEV